MTEGGNAPPSKFGFKHTVKSKKKIQESVRSRRSQLSITATQTMKNKMKNGGWTDDEIKRRVQTRRNNKSYNTDMSACHSEEAIWKRTRTRIKNQRCNGKKFNSSTLAKYNLL